MVKSGLSTETACILSTECTAVVPLSALATGCELSASDTAGVMCNGRTLCAAGTRIIPARTTITVPIAWVYTAATTGEGDRTTDTIQRTTTTPCITVGLTTHGRRRCITDGAGRRTRGRDPGGRTTPSRIRCIHRPRSGLRTG